MHFQQTMEKRFEALLELLVKRDEERLELFCQQLAQHNIAQEHQEDIRVRVIIEP